MAMPPADAELLSLAEPDAAVGQQCDGVAVPRSGRGRRRFIVPARQQAEILQHRRDADVEHARGAPMKIECHIENRVGPGMHGDRFGTGIAVEAADVAVLVVEAHEPVHRRDRCERRLDGRFHRDRRRAGDGDFDERPEQRARTAHAVSLRSGHDQYPA